MAWKTIEESDLLTAISGSELESIRAAALASGQADPVAPTTAAVVGLIRGYIASGGYALDLANTIPPQLISVGVDILAYRLPARVRIDPTEGRKTLNNEAMKILERVSSRDFAIEQAEQSSGEVIGNGKGFFGSSTRLF